MKRLTLPFLLLVAAVVGYVRFTGALNEPEPPPSTYPELVKATQAPDAGRGAGSALACSAAFTAPPKDPPDAAVAVAGPPSEQRSAELDRLSFEQLLAQAKPGELDDAVYRRIATRSQRSEAEEDLHLHQRLDAEMHSGGFHRFFFSSTGDRAVRTREALARIGPPELLQLYDCALTAFPGSKPSDDRAERNAQLAIWGDTQFELFVTLDASYDRLDDLIAARERYIRARLGTGP